MRKDKVSRRKFVVGTAGVAAATMIVPRRVLGGVGYQAPSDTVNVAIIGAGGQGATDAGELLAGGHNIVALADVDFNYVDAAMERRLQPRRPRAGAPAPTPEMVAMMTKMQENAKNLQGAYGKAKRYADFRKLLEEQKDIDGVVIATPDHTHAVIAKAAMELGKHAYIEKPLTWSVHEARVLRETAKSKKVVTQMGNMGHSSADARLVNEWVQAGVIGPVRQVQIWTNRPIGFWPQGIPRPAAKSAEGGAAAAGGAADMTSVYATNEWSMRRFNKMVATSLSSEAGSAPSALNWDLFLGPAPDVPFHPIYHPFNWRGWVDWGTGAVGDMAAHLLDHPYWALGLTYPTSVEATSTPWGMDDGGKPACYPLSSKIVYHFAARGAQPPVTVTWVDGGLMAERPEVLPDDVPLDPGGGVIYIGEKGILMHGTYGAKPKLFPVSLMEAAQKVPQTYPRIPEGDNKQALHRLNWANAIKGKEKASTPLDYAGPLTETMLLGVVAMRTGPGKKITYDGTKGEITNNPSANQYLQREYRKGWTL